MLRAAHSAPSTFIAELKRSAKISEMKIEGYLFSQVCVLSPKKDEAGIYQLLPHSRYANKRKLKLHKYGVGPFCGFSIPTEIRTSGVYAIVSGGVVKYVGRCQNLSARFNSGYGNISPRNCFSGGQQTNCRINNLMFSEASVQPSIHLYFHASLDFVNIEVEIIERLKPSWNLARN